METKGSISLEELVSRIGEICDGIARNGDVWRISLGADESYFVLGPESVCGRVLGLFDEEYGWPKVVPIDRPFSSRELVPGRRCHPILTLAGHCVAMAVSAREYEEILKRTQPSRPNCSESPKLP